MRVHKRRRPRRQGVRPTVGLVVEGDAEYATLPLLASSRLVTNCPPLKASNLGGVGSDRKPEGIAKLVVGKVVAHLAGGRTKVIVCIDRENRDTCPGQFAISVRTALLSELKQRGYVDPDVHVVIADRTFEAWLLADARGLHSRGMFKSAPGFASFEGQNGERSQKGVVELTKLLGHDYRKTIDGPRLFQNIDFATARMYGPGRSGSRSLDKFLRTLGV